MLILARCIVAAALLAGSLHAHAANADTLFETLKGGAPNPGELLDPKEAFRLTVTALDQHTARVEFRIARGYYLYRDRFRFETEAGKVIADAFLPAGDTKEDPFFGRTETYRDHVTISVPLTDADLARQGVRLKVVSQGCADAGVCYMPQQDWVEVKLQAPASADGR